MENVEKVPFMEMLAPTIVPPCLEHAWKLVMSKGVQVSKCDQARDCHVDLPAIKNGVLVSITSSHELLWRRGLELHYQAMTIFSPESLHMLDPRQWSENKPHWPTRLDTFDSNTF